MISSRGTAKIGAFGLLLCAALLLSPCTSHAAGKRKTPKATQAPAVIDGKRTMRLSRVEHVQIAMPDDTLHDFGPDFDGYLTTYFSKSPRVVLIQNSEVVGPRSASGPSAPLVAKPADDYTWEGGILPAATVRIGVKAFTFQTGSRGGRMLYGFDERMPNEVNEYPLQTMFGTANWFDRFFDRKGVPPFDSLAGLDLGDGFDINVLFAWMSVKYATYRSKLHLSIEIDAPLAGYHEVRDLKIQGKGYFYDVAGAYGQWEAGIRVARRDAMFKAFNRAFESASQAIESAVQVLPLTATVDAIDSAGKIFLGTGEKAQVVPGTLYQAVEDPGVVIRVQESLNSGSIGTLAAGDLNDVHLRMRLIQIHDLPIPKLAASRQASKSARVPASLQKRAVASKMVSQAIDLPAENIPQSNLDGLAPKVSKWQAFLKSLIGTATLPYRIMRYFQYDQKFHKTADSEACMGEAHVAEPELEGTAASCARQDPAYVGAEHWSAEAKKQPWAKLIGLDRINAAGPQSVVAVIDSGIDYNHPVLHESVWLNSAPTQDSDGKLDRYGWDFVSGDSRPFDDGYHGTQIASAVLAVAPAAKIMPLKVFNPWGVTQSAAILAAFTYAVDHGARVIVCGWSTRRYSDALERGVAYARDQGVMVVTAAGDMGSDIDRVPTFPASFSGKYENVIAVSATDEKGELLKRSSFGDVRVHIAAPGAQISVAEPRLSYAVAQSSGISAAIVAGAIARSSQPLTRSEFLESWSYRSAPLNGAVDGSRILMIRE